jgi:pimeloyl-ACP methyl ester carboxylesterase
LSARIRHELEGINPAAHYLSAMRAQVILMHGRGDTFIPYTESIALARALPPGQVQLFIIEGYAHTSVRPQREDIPQFLDMMEALLEQRMAVE